MRISDWSSDVCSSDLLVGGARHGQPRVGKAPSQRRIFLAVVHVTVDGLAVDSLDVVGEEVGNVFVGRPVHGYTQLVAVLGLELVFKVLPREQVGTEPVQVGELLVGQQIGGASCGERVCKY